ncbi:hypothetical protein SESBI_07602 [Sesbania bispinosa]|nr:hypothetical protein SESBI_07602 [Sesbania bispinosa]
MMATFFKYVVDELHVLLDIKKNFEDVSTKLLSDKAKISDALNKVKLMTKECDQLSAENILLQQKLATEKAERINAEAEATKAAETAKKALDDLKLERLDRQVKEPELQKEIERIEGLWEDSAEIYFHTAIRQIKFLNPDIELHTRGMFTLCQVEDEKWFNVTPTGMIASSPEDDELIRPEVTTKEVESDKVDIPADEELQGWLYFQSINVVCSSGNLTLADVGSVALVEDLGGMSGHFLFSTVASWD